MAAGFRSDLLAGGEGFEARLVPRAGALLGCDEDIHLDSFI